MSRDGRFFRLQILDGDNVWRTVRGEKTNALKIESEQDDVTDKDGDNWRKLSGFGVRFAEVAITGITRTGEAGAATISTLTSALVMRLTVDARIISGEDGEEVIRGIFQVANLERSGDHNGPDTYNVHLLSALRPGETPPVPPVPPDPSVVAELISFGIYLGEAITPIHSKQPANATIIPSWSTESV